MKAGGHFLIRYCSNTTFVPDPTRPMQESRDAQGQRIVQEWGWLGKVAKAARLYVRRITMDLPNGKQISVVTDLLDEVKYPAEDMLATYHGRWGIETVFHQITDVFSLKHLIGTTPKAVLFQLSYCLLLYNALQVVRAHLASHQAMRGEEDLQREAVLRREATTGGGQRVGQGGPAADVAGRGATAAELRERLREGLQGAGASAGGKRRVRAVAGIRRSRPGAWQPYVDLSRSPAST